MENKILNIIYNSILKKHEILRNTFGARSIHGKLQTMLKFKKTKINGEITQFHRTEDSILRCQFSSSKSIYSL